MRGTDVQPGLFSDVSVEDRVSKDHPIRKLRVLVKKIDGSRQTISDDAAVCAQLGNVVVRGLQPDPHGRHRQVVEFITDLREFDESATYLPP